MKNTNKILITHTAKNYREREGFSLIELSIVLIILGLLVAGVTGGASLIKSAKVNKICNQLTNLKQAWNSYYAQYGTIAGIDNDGNWTSDQAMIDLFNNKLIESGNFNSELNYFCPNGVKNNAERSCSGIGFNFFTNSGDIPEWSEDAIIIWTPDDAGDVTVDEELNKSIDKKLDDGDPDTGNIRTKKGDDGAYWWESMHTLLDIF